MKAWRLDKLGGRLSLDEVAVPEATHGSVVVRVEAVALLSYMKDYVEGKLPGYTSPRGPFTPGTSGVGVIQAIGAGVHHLRVGQRVAVSSYLVANENVVEPAQALVGLTSMGAPGASLLDEYPNGTLAQYALVPASVATPLDELAAMQPKKIVALTRFVVPYGGLLRGRLIAGETVVVTGASGAFGSAAVFLALAMGASRVVAAARRGDVLATVAALGGERVVPVTLGGDVEADGRALRDAAGGADLAFDMVGRATDPNATLAGLKSLRRGGRLVLMGSMTTPLPIPYADVMGNNVEILGQLMYPPDAYRRLVSLARTGQLSLDLVKPRSFPLAELAGAMDAAAKAGPLELVVVRP